MAANILTGPRLGGPSSSGFTVWCRFVGTGSVTLETSPYNTATWTVVDTQTIDDTKESTVVLTATGLDGATRYDYRVKSAGVEVASSNTWTMPTSGRFAVFQIADNHGTTGIEGFLNILDYFEANFEPLGIPAFVLFLGDLSPYQPGESQATTLSTYWTILNHSNFKALCERIPIVYQFDDWDWAGNNSSKNFTNTAMTMPTEADEIQDIIWRERPQPAAPSYGYSVVVCGVPFVLADDRSQRITNQTIGDGTVVPTWSGDEYPGNPNHTCFGSVQREWLKQQFIDYADRGMFVMCMGGTVKDYTAVGFNTTAPAARDSASLYYKSEVNEVFQVAHAYGYTEKGQLLVLTGDDHHTYICDWTLGEVTKINDASMNHPTVPVGPKFREFKTAMKSQVLAIGLGAAYFGNSPGEQGILWHGKGIPTPGSALVMDITSIRNGTHVTADVRFINLADGTLANGDPSYTDDPHWYYENGKWYLADDHDGSQTYPPENAPGPQRREHPRAFMDEIMGTLHVETEMIEDRDNTLREHDDVDEFNRDEWVESTTIRTETTKPEP